MQGRPNKRRKQRPTTATGLRSSNLRLSTLFIMFYYTTLTFKYPENQQAAATQHSVLKHK